VWDLTRGSGIKIGVLDSGLARSAATGGFHDDGLFFGSYGIVPLGFVDDECSSSANLGNCTKYDDNGHGTMMAGLVGENDNNIGYVGIAPMATTYSMKIAWNTYISGHCDNAYFSDTKFCIENDDFARAVDYAASRGFHVLSMSFKNGGNSDVYRALATARNSYGVFLVASTGNTPGGSAQEPASYDVVMGVAAVDAVGNNMYSTAARDVSGFYYGETMVATCYQQAYCNAGSPGQVGGVAGTSTSTAIMAGIVGLIRSYHPNETVSQIWNRLVLTAEGPNKVVNAYAAITYTRPLSVSIGGPATVAPYSSATWTASGSGGTAPYSYTWYRDGVVVGTGATYTGYVEDGGAQLQVNVTDAVGSTATGFRWVATDFGTCGGVQAMALPQEPLEPCY
ncbi:MAG TPA: S8 family serine peptidase, partial [Longimicrobiaceae bacterium]